MIDIDAHFDKVKVDDGDMLVISYPGALTREMADHIRRAASEAIERLGVDAEVLVLDQGLQAALLKTSQLQVPAPPAPTRDIKGESPFGSRP